MQRLHVEADLHPGATLTPSDAQTHYLAHVLRLSPGAPVTLFNGRDGEYAARLTALHRSRATLTAEHRLRPQPEPGTLTLAFAPLKRDATDLLIRQATELGAAALIPVVTARTNTARLNPERLAAITREACEQSERLTLPTIAPLTTLADFLATWPPGRRLAVALERAAPAPIPAATALLIGPEGGFTPAERAALAAAPFAAPLHLGPLVLRAETAAIAGLTLLQAQPWSAT